MTQQKRVLESLQLTESGTGYVINSMLYPDLDPEGIIFNPIVTITSVFPNGGISGLEIIKGGSYTELIANTVDGVGLKLSDSNLPGSMATCTTHLTPKNPPSDA